VDVFDGKADGKAQSFVEAYLPQKAVQVRGGSIAGAGAEADNAVGPATGHEPQAIAQVVTDP